MENKSKNYEILQIIAKIGRILSTVAFVFSIIGISGCFLGWISTSLGSDGLFKIEGITIHGLLSDLDDSNGKSVGATLAAWLIICAGQAVLAKFAEIYFRNVLAAGTPFTQSGAGELRRLGIMTMIIPTGCAVLGEILQEIIAGFMNVTAGGWEELNFDNEASVVVGVMFLVGSFLCGYGAEMSAENNINLLQE